MYGIIFWHINCQCFVDIDHAIFSGVRQIFLKLSTQGQRLFFKINNEVEHHHTNTSVTNYSSRPFVLASVYRRHRHFDVTRSRPKAIECEEEECECGKVERGAHEAEVSEHKHEVGQVAVGHQGGPKKKHLEP